MTRQDRIPSQSRRVASIWLIFLLVLVAAAAGRPSDLYGCGDAVGELAANQTEVRKNNCGQHKPRSGRIAGGYPANPGEFPSYVKLVVDIGYNRAFLCGGTIISEWLILTAGHCVENVSQIKGIRLFFGHTKKNTGTTMEARSFCLPKEYVDFERSDFDMALVVVGKPIEFNELVQPACLPSFDIDSRTQAHVVGYGMMNRSKKKPDELQVLPVRRENLCFVRRGSSKICFKSNDPNNMGDVCQGEFTC